MIIKKKTSFSLSFYQSIYLSPSVTSTGMKGEPHCLCWTSRLFPGEELTKETQWDGTHSATLYNGTRLRLLVRCAKLGHLTQERDGDIRASKQKKDKKEEKKTEPGCEFWVILWFIFITFISVMSKGFYFDFHLIFFFFFFFFLVLPPPAFFMHELNFGPCSPRSSLSGRGYKFRVLRRLTGFLSASVSNENQES